MAPHDHAHGSPFAPSDSPGRTPDAQLPDTRGKIAVAFAFTATILLAQAIGAALTGSLALLTDTVHMVIDASGLLLALVAAPLARRPALAGPTTPARPTPAAPDTPPMSVTTARPRSLVSSVTPRAFSCAAAGFSLLMSRAVTTPRIAPATAPTRA